MLDGEEIIDLPPDASELLGDHPARILRIETGSTEIMLAVAKGVEKILSPLLAAAATQWFANRSRDGMLKRHAADVSAAKQFAELLAMLPNDDERTPEMEQRLLIVGDRLLGDLEKVIDRPQRMQLNGKRPYEEARFRFETPTQPRLAGPAQAPLPEAPK